MPEVVALGDINVDIIAHFPSYPAKGQDALASSTEFHCGGSAANTARALAWMGLEVGLISRLGPDPLASRALEHLAEAGVSPTGLQRDPAAPTGLMYIVVTPDGERTMLGNRGANVWTDPNQVREEEIRASRLLHLSGYALLSDPQRSAALLALEMATRHDLIVTLDPGMSVPQAALEEMRALLPVIDVLLPNLPEAQRLAGLTAPKECAEWLLALGVGAVALKLGEAGCLVCRGTETLWVPGFSIEAHDTTGAGDYFAAGAIAGFLRGLDWHGSAVLANVMGALAATRTGAGTSMPRAREVVDLLDAQATGPEQREHLAAIRQARDFVEMLATKPEEEGKRWWK
ncbi:MAG: carbohydrate kinase family protein [Anaerolineae bacterium]|jgi:ribokinase